MISLTAIGPSRSFSYGLAIGTCAAVLSLYIISFTIKSAAEKGKRKPVVFGYIGRVLLYGGALCLAANTAVYSLAGAAIGLLLPHVTMYIAYGILPVLKRKIKKEPAAEWVADTGSMLFVKEPHLVKFNNGKTYLTHRHYRKIRIYSNGT